MIDWRELTVSERLRVLRRSQNPDREVTQVQFAAFLGENPETYGMAERHGRLSTRLADKIASKCPGIDYGWLYEGLRGNMSSGTEERLYDAANRLGLAAARQGTGR